MKNTALLLLTFITFNSYSQVPKGFSLSAGMSSTNLKSSDLPASADLGYRFGIMFGIGYHESYNYQFDIFYNSNPINFSADGLNKTLNYSSLDSGFYFNYYVMKPDEDKFYFGPQFGLGVTLNSKFTDDGNQINALQDMSKINYNLGFGIAGGYNRFNFNLRYDLGLNNTLSSVKYGGYTDQYGLYKGGSALNGKLNAISFTVGYKLSLD